MFFSSNAFNCRRRSCASSKNRPKENTIALMQSKTGVWVTKKKYSLTEFFLVLANNRLVVFLKCCQNKQIIAEAQNNWVGEAGLLSTHWPLCSRGTSFPPENHGGTGSLRSPAGDPGSMQCVCVCSPMKEQSTSLIPRLIWEWSYPNNKGKESVPTFINRHTTHTFWNSSWICAPNSSVRCFSSSRSGKETKLLTHIHPPFLPPFLPPSLPLSLHTHTPFSTLSFSDLTVSTCLWSWNAFVSAEILQ